MREILLGRLWTGNARDARDRGKLHSKEVAAVVDVAAEEPPAAIPRDIIYCRFPIVDGVGNSADVLHLAVNTTAEFLKYRTRTLVCCGAGLSRAPAIAAAAIAISSGEPADSVLRQYFGNGSHDIAPAFWSDVCHASDPSLR